MLYNFVLFGIFNSSNFQLYLLTARSAVTQPAFNFSKLTIETVEQGVKYVQS